MARIARILGFGLVVGLSLSAPAEIVRVTAERTRLYDAETKAVRTAKIEGKRFMVYGSAKGWYLVEMTINKKQAFRWIPKADVEVDWGPTKTARVVAVHNVNTLELSNGDWVQFAGIVVNVSDTPLAGRTLAWLKKLLEGKQVVVEYDEKPRKRRGYDLGYVYVGGVFVNRVLVERGLATVPYSYLNARGRYAAVFGYFVRQARKQERGIWAVKKPQEEAPKPTEPVEETPPAEPTDPGRQYVHHLSDAERAQWARNLITEVSPKTNRTKETISEGNSSNRTYTDNICWRKTLEITVKNGWGFAIQGMKAKYDLFGKTGKTSESLILHQSGEIADMDLKPGETRLFKTDAVEFKGSDSSVTGWTGMKYYGYRVTFYYRGSAVKVVAVPSSLADYGSEGTD